jgi:hypothetical protein
MKIVEIEWVDSCGTYVVWADKDSGSLEPVPIESVGYLWEATKHQVTLVQSLSPEQIGHKFTIPRGCIRKYRVIRK